MPLPVGQGGQGGSSPPTPAAVARALLDRVVAYYAEHADPDNLDAPVPLPDRRFVAGGEPRVIAWDLEVGQVHVAYERTIRAADPTSPTGSDRLPRRGGSPTNKLTRARSVVLEVQVVRPAPGLGQLRALPTQDELDRHGYALGLDLHHLHAAVREAAEGEHLTRANVAEARIDLADCLSLGPSGKVAAVAQGLVVPLL